MSTLTSPTGGPVANPILIPGGVTASNSDGTYLYLAGQQLQTSGPYKGLFAGNLTTINLTTYAVSAPVSISDGTHTKLLFADNDTLWIASSHCANGVRAATAATELAAQGFTDQAGNYNCLTMRPPAPPRRRPRSFPAVVQSNVSAAPRLPSRTPTPTRISTTTAALTGLCWVQSYHKVFTGVRRPDPRLLHRRAIPIRLLKPSRKTPTADLRVRRSTTSTSPFKAPSST